jgi:4-nitrophenyl phosphatase
MQQLSQGKDGLERHRIHHLLLDMDGVVYRGSRPMPDLPVLRDFLEETGFSFMLITNNASLDSRQFSEKLASMGWPVPPERIVTTAEAAAWYVAQNSKDCSRKVYVIGMPALRSAIIERSGADFRWDEDNPDWVVVGIDFSLTYEKLRVATLAIRKGAKFVATNGDAVFPAPEGLIPGNGAIVAALRTATGVDPIILGKPEPTLFQVALERLRAHPREVLMVGDNLATDIAGAKKVGMVSALILTGVSDEADVESADVKPDMVFRSLTELVAWLRENVVASS